MRAATLAVVATLALTGCETRLGTNTGDSKPNETSPPAAPPPREEPLVRRATAEEILNAASTGAVPDWFSDAERRAVRRIQN